MGILVGFSISTWSQKTRDLVNHVIRSEEEIIALGKLLDELLVLVELLQILDGHVVNFAKGWLAVHRRSATKGYS